LNLSEVELVESASLEKSDLTTVR